MAIPGFTADESVGPTLHVYRSPPATHDARGLRPQNLDAEEAGADDADDLGQDSDDMDQDDGELGDGDDSDAGGDDDTTDEDSSSGDA